MMPIIGMAYANPSSHECSPETHAPKARTLPYKSVWQCPTCKTNHISIFVGKNVLGVLGDFALWIPYTGPVYAPPAGYVIPADT